MPPRQEPTKRHGTPSPAHRSPEGSRWAYSWGQIGHPQPKQSRRRQACHAQGHSRAGGRCKLESTGPPLQSRAPPSPSSGEQLPPARLRLPGPPQRGTSTLCMFGGAPREMLRTLGAKSLVAPREQKVPTNEAFRAKRFARWRNHVRARASPAWSQGIWAQRVHATNSGQLPAKDTALPAPEHCAPRLTCFQPRRANLRADTSSSSHEGSGPQETDLNHEAPPSPPGQATPRAPSLRCPPHKVGLAPAQVLGAVTSGERPRSLSSARPTGFLTCSASAARRVRSELSCVEGLLPASPSGTRKEPGFAPRSQGGLPTRTVSGVLQAVSREGGETWARLLPSELVCLGLAPSLQASADPRLGSAPKCLQSLWP